MELDKMLEATIHSLVDEQDSVQVRSTISAHSAHFEVEVAQTDFGKLIGRKGILAESLRRLFSAAYGKQGLGFHLHVVDPRRQNKD
jgi:predicted RNA-binding protein YlqC (UPF0109 family)